ncbi:SLAP domain-containing protein [Schleiferilactobacillus harbinensis]|jgi:hypothetical protein|uniref:SLAP domain-containing protein n=1 Tax=Schleiferilactobacillus harbinensis TaxID=304207 RepID=UPI00242B0434|nr:SLAP domain-containing protein [Schleiferilactobacillus harbinensis]MCI1850035.1 SLAP domain-containing protein [Schleiferilactobacillus harbinensis]
MKKFSKVKYFGAVAAALLAVAPVAAPVVSSIASPAIVQASAQSDAQNVLDHALTSSVTVSATNSASQAALSAYLGKTSNDYITQPATPPTTAPAAESNLLGAAVDPKATGYYQDLTGYKLQFKIADYAGYDSLDSLAHDLLVSGKTSFTVNAYLYDPSDTSYTTPLATKAITLNLTQVANPIAATSASVADGASKIGASLAPLTSFASIASATTFADASGATTAATVADFTSFIGWTSSANTNVTTADVTPSAAGTYYALFSVNPAKVAVPANTNPSVALRTSDNGTTWVVARKVVIADYIESSASGTAYITNGHGATVFSDPTTSTATGRSLDLGSAWKVYGAVKNSAGTVLAYNLGGSQYVKASDVSSTPVSTQGGVFTVRYPANNKWSIAVYNSSLKVQKLIPAGSTWTTFGVKTLKDGKSYYNVGGDQWVRTDYGYWNAN